jgi:hypothetical protein|nr:MAG TPA: hypothetical protein [Caudoviricetes sp.]
MNLEKLKQAEIVYGEKIDHPDDTYGDGHIGSELSITVESYGFKATVLAADAEYLARAGRVVSALMDTDVSAEKEPTNRRGK